MRYSVKNTKGFLWKYSLKIPIYFLQTLLIRRRLFVNWVDQNI